MPIYVSNVGDLISRLKYTIPRFRSNMATQPSNAKTKSKSTSSKTKPEESASTAESSGSGGNKKRGRADESEKSAPKRQRTRAETIGSKHDSAEAPAPAGSATRLPKKGQRVSWKAMPGWVHGVTQEVVDTIKEVNGKQVKGSKKDPRIVLKADSGKICVHKCTAVHF